MENLKDVLVVVTFRRVDDEKGVVVLQKTRKIYTGLDHAFNAAQSLVASALLEGYDLLDIRLVQEYNVQE